MSSRPESPTPAALISCRKLLVAGVVALWLALLAGLLGRYAWPLDLFSHFRVQYAVLFIALAAASAMLGRKMLVALSLAGMLLSAIPVFAYLSWPPASAQANTEAHANPEAFRLVSFNVWFRNRDCERIADYLEHTQADAIVLQELTKPQAARLRALLPSYPHAYVQPGRYGAAVFARWPIMETATVPLSSGGARAARVVIEWHHSRVTLLGVHLHWPLGPRNFRWRNQELARLAGIAKSERGPLLIAGDFNATSWSAHYRNLISDAELNDCAAGHGIAPSWPAQFPPLGIPIDHCLASKQWRSIDVSTGPYLGSDHRPLIAELMLVGGESEQAQGGRGRAAGGPTPDASSATASPAPSF